LKFKEFEVPEDLMYTRDHEWAKIIDEIIRVGITDFAAKSLNDVVYVSLPKVGTKVVQAISFGTVESIKAVSELYSPFSGVISKVNSQLEIHPELVNLSPYEEGWLMELRPSSHQDEKGKLMSAVEYTEFLKSATPK
jgi:glycine cleavage system H protein